MSINVKGFELASGEFVVCNFISEDGDFVEANMPVRIEYKFDEQNRAQFNYFPYNLITSQINIQFSKDNMSTMPFDVVKELAEVYQKIRLQFMLNLNLIKDVENAVEQADNSLPASFAR